MYKKVLLAVDDSIEAKKAAEHVAELAKNGVIESVTAIHVVPAKPEEKPRWPGEYGQEIPAVKEASPETAQSVKPKLGFVEAILKDANIAAEIKILEGNPGEVICVLVDKEKYDLVVMGSRGLSRLEGIIMESVSHHVILNASCPVLIFNPRASGLAPAPREVYEI